MDNYKITLEAARVNAKMTQRDAAREIGVDVSTIGNWERGTTTPDTKRLVRLCEVYGCPIDVLFLCR